MALKNAPWCSVCGKHRTKDESGVCSQCRRLAPQGRCVVCGNAVRLGNSVCHLCRRTLDTGFDLEAVIAKEETKLRILRLRQEGTSFERISAIIGLSKTAVYATYRVMMHVPVHVPEEGIEVLEALRSAGEYAYDA